MRLETKRIITIIIFCLAVAYHLQPVVAMPPNIDNFNSHQNIFNQQSTPVPISAVATNTPNEDGIITHTVKYGETLFTISQAYGVPIDQILNNSGLGQSTTEIREGQVLLIQTAQEPSPPTPTEEPHTPTPTVPRPTMTPFPTRTPAPTFTPTPLPSIIHRTLGQGTYVGVALIVICGIGLILVIYKGFVKAK